MVSRLSSCNLARTFYAKPFYLKVLASRGQRSKGGEKTEDNELGFGLCPQKNQAVPNGIYQMPLSLPVIL